MTLNLSTSTVESLPLREASLELRCCGMTSEEPFTPHILRLSKQLCKNKLLFSYQKQDALTSKSKDLPHLETTLGGKVHKMSATSVPENQ